MNCIAPRKCLILTGSACCCSCGLLAIFANRAKIEAMTTVTMNISLTDDLKAFVDTCVKTRGYSSSSEYVRDLLRRDEEHQKEEQFKALIQAGLDSPIDPRPWEEIREEWSKKINTARAVQARKSA
ncbi:MAG: hypothetical protein RIS34_2185 [Pseudomonadota bacterium]